MRTEAHERLQDIEPREPSKDGLEIFNPSEKLDFPLYAIAFDPITGCLTLLFNKATSRIWCSEDKPIGLFCYESFSQACYDRWLREYNVNLEQTGCWAIPDFSKPGMDAAIPRPEHRIYLPRIVEARFKQTGNEIDILLELRMPESCTQILGAPRKIFIEYQFRKKLIDIRLQWFQKKACRLPEAS